MVLVVSGDLTCSLARVQIFTLGVRMVQFRATVVVMGRWQVVLSEAGLLVPLLL